MLSAFSSASPSPPPTVNVTRKKIPRCEQCRLPVAHHSEGLDGLLQCPSFRSNTSSLEDVQVDEHDVSIPQELVADHDESDDDASVASSPPTSEFSFVSISSSRTQRPRSPSAQPEAGPSRQSDQPQPSYQTVTTVPNTENGEPGPATPRPVSPAGSWITTPTVPNTRTPESQTQATAPATSASFHTQATVPSSDIGNHRPWRPTDPYFPLQQAPQQQQQQQQQQLALVDENRGRSSTTGVASESNKENAPPDFSSSSASNRSSQSDMDSLMTVDQSKWAEAVRVSGAQGTASLYRTSSVYVDHLRQAAQGMRLRTGVMREDFTFMVDSFEHQASTLVVGADGFTVDKIIDMHHATTRGYQKIALQKLDEVEPVSPALLLTAGVMGGLVLLGSLSLL